ncbi:hypothetical protein JYT74_03740 [Crocinitomix catalasitica]|nr:hypothetical protein [Crocinitomix catalasitica]
MKNSILLIGLISLSLSANSTNAHSNLSSDSLSAFYILDKSWSTGSSYRYETDDSPNYIQIVHGEMAFSARVRGKEYLFMGAIEGLEIVQDGEGNTVTKFFVIGTERNLGQRRSFEIIEKPAGEVSLHYFRKLGGADVFFSAHAATISEKNKIFKYWAGEY